MAAPDTITCAYCGRVTEEYQLVSQIPNSNCDQLFILSEIFATNGDLLKPSDYVCFDHEDTFHIKYCCKVRNKPYAKSFLPNFSVSQLETKCCAKCESTIAVKYFYVNNFSESFKNFLVNEVKIGTNKVTRRGSGISETSVLCRACYYQLLKKKSNITYTPQKKPLKSLQSPSLQLESPEIDNALTATTTESRNEEDRASTQKSQEMYLDLCAWCGKGRSRKGAKLQIITDTIKGHINTVLKHSTQIPEKLNTYCRLIHKGGQEKCYTKLFTESRKLVTDQQQRRENAEQSNEEQYNEGEEVIDDEEYHDHVATSTAEYSEETGDLPYFVEELIEKKLSNELAADLPTIFETVNEEVEVSRREFETIIKDSLDKHPHRKLHQPSKKYGRFIYDDRTDFIVRSHELDCNQEEKQQYSFDTTQLEGAQASELFHVMKEIRAHVASAGKLCDIYATYPELLSSITLEQLLFTGLQVKVNGVATEVPSIDPLLFNFFYYITCSEEEAKSFEMNLTAEFDLIYQEGYKNDTKIIYSRVLSTVFDILHQRNKDNIYPLQILYSDLIANTKPTKLMEYFSTHRKCASTSKFDQYKVTMASHVKKLKENGDILGVLPDRFLAIHMDNLEQYQKNARNPAKALTSSLVVAAQQPLPSSISMKLQPGNDVRRIVWEEEDELEKDKENEQDDDVEWNRLDDKEEEGDKDYEIMEEEGTEEVEMVVGLRNEINILAEKEANKEMESFFESLGSNEPLPGIQDINNDTGISTTHSIAEPTATDSIPAEETQTITEPCLNVGNYQEDASAGIGTTHSIAEPTATDSIPAEETHTITEPCLNEGNVQEDDYESDSTAYSQSTETTESSDVTMEDYERPVTRSASNVAPSLKRTLESEFEFRPRYKRLRLDFEVDHEKIPKYSVPPEVEQDSRQSKVEDFTCTSDENELIETLNNKIITHALLQLEGQHYEEDTIKQFIPSFKETLAWGEPVTEKSNTAYLELIPGPPDNVDTILYALSLVKELFVDKLGHVNVVVCGDGKTVNVLYKIKDEYGSEMSWLVVMLGTWHMLKAYMEVFYKKYDSVFCRHLLSKVMTPGNVDAILSAKNWGKSHNHLLWIMSAVLRENVVSFQEHYANGDLDELTLYVSQAVEILKSVGNDQIKKEDTFNFAKKQNMANDAFKQHDTAYKTFMTTGYSSDDQFALFSNAIEDFTAYMAVYISIRTGDWALRVAGIKMMAMRFVRSGATLYQWLVIRHLADISDTSSYPPHILDRLKSGAWVSSLRDSQGATLARDEYHERTASLQIQLRMPKQLTKQNMQVLTQYVTYSAATRNNLLEEIFRTNDRSRFELAKGCRRSWIDEQEHSINIFSSMLKHERVFSIENRELKQPFTETVAKQSTKKDFLGRDAFGEDRKDYGKEVLLSYVLPRFCRTKHAVSSEKMPMRKKTLSLFPKDKDNKAASRAKVAAKEKEDMIEVLAAGIIQLSSNQNSGGELNLAGCQISDTPGLLAENQHQPNRKKDKTGIRQVLEKRYEDAFIPPIISRNDTAAIIRDGMQDLFLSPLKHHLTFLDYYNLFVEVKVKTSFAVSSTVVFDFDSQNRDTLVPKDNLRLIRDSVPSTVSGDVDISDDAIIPPKTSWTSFLANRKNKARLVEYLCLKMKNHTTLLRPHEKLLVSFEGKVFQSTHDGCQEIDHLSNNHMECDTRAFFLLSQLADSKPNWIVKSTDTDFMFAALLNYSDICREKNVYLKYNTNGQGAKYCCINDLVQQIKGDPQFAILETRSLPSPQLLGMLHFLTGCDDLSFLRGFTKNFCFKVFEKYSEKICPENAIDVDKILSGDEKVTGEFMVRFVAFLYGHKFSSSFERGEVSSLVLDAESKVLLDTIRRKTWHKTISVNNTMPSLAAILLHAKRFSYVLNSFGNATKAFLNEIKSEDHGWMIVIVDNEPQIVPKWDSDASMEEINLVRKSYLRKCGCTKGCRNRQCSCVKNSPNVFCSTLCTCIGCVNKPGEEEVADENVDMEDSGADFEDGNEDEDPDVNLDEGYNHDDSEHDDNEGEYLIV